MKLGQFETFGDGRVRVAAGAEYDRCIYEGFVRALHEANERGELGVYPPGLEASSDPLLHVVEHFLGSVGATIGTIPQRLSAIRARIEWAESSWRRVESECVDLRMEIEKMKRARELNACSARNPSTTGDSTHAPAQWPSTAFRESL